MERKFRVIKDYKYYGEIIFKVGEILTIEEIIAHGKEAKGSTRYYNKNIKMSNRQFVKHFQEISPAEEILKKTILVVGVGVVLLNGTLYNKDLIDIKRTMNSADIKITKEEFDYLERLDNGKT